MEKEITADDFLKGLSDHSSIFDLSISYDYTESQLLLFAEMYHREKTKQPDLINEAKEDKRQLLINFMSGYITGDKIIREADMFIINQFLEEG